MEIMVYHHGGGGGGGGLAWYGPVEKGGGRQYSSTGKDENDGKKSVD